MIARRHFISRSYLDRLFETEDASVQQTIRGKRLDRSRRDLTDRGLAGESVFEIASRWGFRSASHFSRSFRAAYGQSPSDFRMRVLGERPEPATERAQCLTSTPRETTVLVPPGPDAWVRQATTRPMSLLVSL
jgi:AraC-like DNA-binding protein